jgi:hypothetical protein
MHSFSNLKVVLDGLDVPVKTGVDRERLVDSVRSLITRINHGMDFGHGLADEWTRYLEMLPKGFGDNLQNPYTDLAHFDAAPLLESSAYSDAAESIRFLEQVSKTPLPVPSGETASTMSQTLLILAVGGADSTFYGGLSRAEIHEFEKELFPSGVIRAFAAESSPGIIPRALVGKRCVSGECVCILESIILQAYRAGIRNVAVIGNSQTGKPLQTYMKDRLDRLRDLHWTVTFQPLLPMIRLGQVEKDHPIVSPESGAYPGGHGHGFKCCLEDPAVRDMIRQHDLKYFLFSNGDNAVLFNWGAGHAAWALREMENAKSQNNGGSFYVGFFLVWETLRKGGFAYRLKRKDSDETHVQMIENELAAGSGVSMRSMENRRAAYNTNVALGLIGEVLPHLAGLPMALKWKVSGGVKRAAFEASLSTALTVRQCSDGSSVFIPEAALFFLPPEHLPHPHWTHISIRKRGDWFAFMSSLFTIRKSGDAPHDFSVIMTERNAREGYPVLEGNILDHGVLDNRAFFDVFKDSEIDADAFTGILRIDLLEREGLPRGNLRFRGKIKLLGPETISITVPTGEEWVLENRTLDSPSSVALE